METKNEGLTREEKVMFSILGIILVIAIGVLIINTLSKNERTLKEETPINETENKGTEDVDNLSESDIILIEDDTDNTIYKSIAYVTNLNTSKNSTSSINNNSKENEIQNTTGDDVPVIRQWDFPKDIVTSATAGTTIKIDKNVILEDGSMALAQVTVRKLIDDTYMIQDISEGSILLSEGTYKYYYTYADTTKELVLTVSGYLNPTEASLPSIIDTKGLDEEYLDNYEKLIENSSISVVDNKININLKEVNNITEIPIYLTLSADLTDASVASKMFGVIVDKETLDGYSELESNQIVMLINLEIISTTNLDNIEILINGVTYIVNVKITYSDDEDDYVDKDSDIEDNEEENAPTEIEEDVELPDKTNPDNNELLENNDTNENSEEIINSDFFQNMLDNIFLELS